MMKFAIDKKTGKSILKSPHCYFCFNDAVVERGGVPRCIHHTPPKEKVVEEIPPAPETPRINYDYSFCAPSEDDLT